MGQECEGNAIPLFKGWNLGLLGKLIPVHMLSIS